MDKFFIRPAVEGARLPDPSTGDILGAAGEWKPRDHNWLRAEMRGDVEQCDPPADVEPQPEPGAPPPVEEPQTEKPTLLSSIFGRSAASPTEPAAEPTDPEHDGH